LCDAGGMSVAVHSDAVDSLESATFRELVAAIDARRGVRACLVAVTAAEISTAARANRVISYFVIFRIYASSLSFS
jgi:hypothetical protein